MSLDKQNSSTDRRSEMSTFVKKRQYIRQRVTKINNDSTVNLSMDKKKREMHVTNLKSLKKDLDVLNQDIYILAQELGESETELNERMSVDDSYDECIANALSQLEPDESIVTNNQSLSLVTGKMRLPEISLPEFSNSKTESLDRFLFSLESILGKHKLSPYEKYLYLKTSLSGPPRVLVESLDPTDQTFEQAKALLMEAFGSVKTRKYETLDRLANLKLSNSGDPYTYIGNMRTIISSVRSLDISIDDVLQFFVWRGLNDRFQSQLVNITNSNRPSLQQIIDKIFEATERYIKLLEQRSDSKSLKQNSPYNRSSSKTETKVFAANVNSRSNKFIKCNLCVKDHKDNVEHTIKECQVYKSAEEKVQKLKDLNACTRCSFINHSTSQCKFEFTSNCKICKGKHMTYLCLVKKPCSNTTANMVLDSEARTQTPTTNSSVSWVEAFKTSDDEDSVILPTFTTEIVANNSITPVRILKDSGSQRNFIEDKLVKSLRLPVLRTTELTIHGFNSSKKLLTNIVNVPLRIGDKTEKVECVSVPQININLNISTLKPVIDEFVSKGYDLADEYLMKDCSVVDNIQIIFGATSDPLLSCTYHNFGNNKKSCYIESPIGILLSGDIPLMIKNLKYLPDRTVNFVQNSVNNASDTGKDEYIYNMNSLVSFDSSDITLDDASVGMLEDVAGKILDFDKNDASPSESEENLKLVNYVLDKTERSNDGRLVMPLPWNYKVKHLLATNYNLSKSILMSNLKKLQKNEEKLTLYDAVFQEQEELGIIERINDVQGYINNHESSFLPHTGVFKLSRETTKCRVVFLSNLCEKTPDNPNLVSHNQAMLPGPCLNQKLSTVIIMTRFDRYLLTFDICKAFLNIALREEDSSKLLFLWFRNIRKKDYTIIAFRNKRLSFGLRPSPTILMLALFKLLIEDAEDDEPSLKAFKRAVYNTMYMDNGSFTCNDLETLRNAYELLREVFQQVKFNLQQFCSNDEELQNTIDQNENEITSAEVKFFGMKWDRIRDNLSPFPLKLNPDAKTKRQILSSLHSIYDIFNIYGPLLNRAKLFFQRLQVDKSIGWDTCLSQEYLREWVNIAKQANKVPSITIPRYVGYRDGTFELIAFSDASKELYGVVVYIREKSTGQVRFLMSRNKVLSKEMAAKSIPTLEFQALTFAAELLVDLFQELAGSKVVVPVCIEKMLVYTDSMISLYWLQAYFKNFEKMQKRSVFIMNRLKQIDEHCKIHPITFSYSEGNCNPADCVTRVTNFAQLNRQRYHDEPEFLLKNEHKPDFEVHVPSPNTANIDTIPDSDVTDGISQVLTAVTQPAVHFMDVERYSSFTRAVRVCLRVLQFVYNLKTRIKLRCAKEDWPTYETACSRVISTEQQIYFPEVFGFFEGRRNIADAPDIVLKFNLFLDKNNLIRVKGKLRSNFPILLPNNSYLTKLIIRNIHQTKSHIGLYHTLKEMRKQFFIPKHFSVVRRQLRECVICQRVNGRPVKLNQNRYREFRCQPPSLPFSAVFVDYLGPFCIQWQNGKTKVWLLLITCLWSRAVNILICFKADVQEFLRTLQMHIFQYGMFASCVSDLGSQLTAGSRIIKDLLDDPDTHDFLTKQGIASVSFDHYAKGNSSLGSLVEVCVKQVKLLINKSIGRSVLEYSEFQLLIAKANHLINRRPIAFKESLRDSIIDRDLPEPITPEMLIRGRELPSLTIVPCLHVGEVESEYRPDSDLSNGIKLNYSRLKAANSRLVTHYNSEFQKQLFEQSIDKRDRYRPVNHVMLRVGDVVLLVDSFSKQSNYPMGIVIRTECNSLGEVTAAEVLKGRTRERVYRHASSLIPLLSAEGFEVSQESSMVSEAEPLPSSDTGRPSRAAAKESKRKIRELLTKYLI